jgi:hypothetical protein
MPRAKRIPRGMREPLSESFKEYLLFGIDPAPRKYKDSFRCFLAIGTPAIEEIWNNYKEEILESWIVEYPGSRPFAWWEWDAPRDEDLIREWRYHHTFPIARLQTSGKGTTNQARYSGMLPSFSLAIPDSWHEIDKANPPTFESQAAYLKRHGLLTKEEMRTLTDADYAPERITEIMEF